MKQRPILCTCNKSGAIWSFWYVYTGSNHLTYLRVTKWCYVKYTLFGDFFFLGGGGIILIITRVPVVFELQTCGSLDQSLTVPIALHPVLAKWTISQLAEILMLWRSYKKCNSHGVSRTLNRNDWLIIYLLNLQCWRAILEYLQGILDFLTIRLSWTNYILFIY